MMNSNYDLVPAIGEIYMMDFSGCGNGRAGWRPGVVLQNNIGNIYSDYVIAVPVTSSIKKVSQPTHVLLPAVSGLYMDSMVKCENPATIPKSLVGRYITKLSADFMREIAVASSVATGAISFLSAEDVLNVWKKAVQMNASVWQSDEPITPIQQASYCLHPGIKEFT